MADYRLLHKRCGHSEKVSALPNIEYEVWIGYMLAADDFGVMRASALTLQADNDRLASRSRKTIERSIDHLVSVDLLGEFTHQGRRYVFQIDWQDYQRLEYPTRTINPKPPNESIAQCSSLQARLFTFHPGGCRVSGKTPGEVGDNSEKVFQEIREHSAPSRARTRVNANANANANDHANALEGFAAFYARYPRHKKPGDAEKAWKSVKGAEKREEIMAALERQIASGEWTDPKFILYPGSWLRGKCWEDEITPGCRRGPQVLIPKPDRVDWGTECDELHGGTCGNQGAHALVMQRQKVSA